MKPKDRLRYNLALSGFIFLSSICATALIEGCLVNQSAYLS